MKAIMHQFTKDSDDFNSLMTGFRQNLREQLASGFERFRPRFAFGFPFSKNGAIPAYRHP